MSKDRPYLRAPDPVQKSTGERMKPWLRPLSWAAAALLALLGGALLAFQLGWIGDGSAGRAMVAEGPIPPLFYDRARVAEAETVGAMNTLEFLEGKNPPKLVGDLSALDLDHADFNRYINILGTLQAHTTRLREKWVNAFRRGLVAGRQGATVEERDRWLDDSLEVETARRDVVRAAALLLGKEEMNAGTLRRLIEIISWRFEGRPEMVRLGLDPGAHAELWRARRVVDALTNWRDRPPKLGDLCARMLEEAREHVATLEERSQRDDRLSPFTRQLLQERASELVQIESGTPEIVLDLVSREGYFSADFVTDWLPVRDGEPET